MSRKPLAALAALVASLATVGVALAHDGGHGSIQAVTATFAATNVSQLESATCTAADGTYRRTNATYTGTATSADPRLNGELTVHVKSLYNTTTNVGAAMGGFLVQNESGQTEAHFRAVLSNGTLTGFVEGEGDSAKLLGTVSASYDPETGLTDGQLGARTLDGSAVFASPPCSDDPPEGEKPPPPPPHDDGGAPPKHGKKGKHGKHGKHGRR